VRSLDKEVWLSDRREMSMRLEGSTVDDSAYEKQNTALIRYGSVI
jgi:hypothetical protein